MPQATTLVFVADLHVGHPFAVCPATWTLHDGNTFTPNPLQQIIREHWRATWERIGAQRKRRRLIVCIVGDAIEGLLMPDNTMIRPKWLATQAKAALPQVVILAACGSQLRSEDLKSMAEEISRNGLNVVGFSTQTEDRAAVRFNTEFVRALVAGGTVGNAFDVALEEISEFEAAQGVFLTPGLMNGYYDVARRLEDLEVGQQELRNNVRLIMQRLGV